MPEVSSKERMIAAAVTLFARAGFSGVTTRDIALKANVSEGNIFRYFPHKRDLFVSAVDSELSKLSIRAAGLLIPNGGEQDARSALRTLFEVITDAVVKQPDLVRLLRYSTLEFGPDMEPVYRKHMDAIFAATAKNFTAWSQSYGFRDLNARVTVLSFVATVVLLQDYPMICRFLQSKAQQQPTRNSGTACFRMLPLPTRPLRQKLPRNFCKSQESR
jgi:AcrR family transcriptional regulator